MDKRIIPLLLLTLLLFSMCLGGEKEGITATTQAQQTGAAVQAEETQAKTTTTLLQTTKTADKTEPASSTTRLRITQATTTTFSSYKGCSKCSDGTVCGQSYKEGEKDVICTGIMSLPDGEYSSCYLSKGTICNSCYDGTACGQTNQKGALCQCDQKVGEGMYMYCYPGTPKCSNCSDGTVCGNVTAEGKLCHCYPPCTGEGCSEYDICELK